MKDSARPSEEVDTVTAAPEPEPARDDDRPAAPAEDGRARAVEPGHLPVSEFAFDRAGAGSPFGDDVTFPLPVENLTYQHPED